MCFFTCWSKYYGETNNLMMKCRFDINRNINNQDKASKQTLPNYYSITNTLLLYRQVIVKKKEERNTAHMLISTYLMHIRNLYHDTKYAAGCIIYRSETLFLNGKHIVFRLTKQIMLTKFSYLNMHYIFYYEYSALLDMKCGTHSFFFLV